VIPYINTGKSLNFTLPSEPVIGSYVKAVETEKGGTDLSLDLSAPLLKIAEYLRTGQSDLF
jgi:hypothetical protein